MGKSGGKKRKGKNKAKAKKALGATGDDDGNDSEDERTEMMLQDECLAPLRALTLSMENPTSPKLQDYYTRMKEEEVKAASERKVDPLRDFTKPKREDCPLCLIELPCDIDRQMYLPCCGISVCAGCFFQKATVFCKTVAKSAVLRRQTKSAFDEKFYGHLQTCPFCRRTTVPNSSGISCDADLAKQIHLAENSDSPGVRMYRIAGFYYDKECDRMRAGKTYDFSSAREWFERSGKAGYGHALEMLGDLDRSGILGRNDLLFGLDMGFYEEAAEKGSVTAWLKMYMHKKTMGLFGAAIEDLRKAIICGVAEDDCTKDLLCMYKDGMITKEEYLHTIRRHQETVDSLRSPSRDEELKLMLG